MNDRNQPNSKRTLLVKRAVITATLVVVCILLLAPRQTETTLSDQRIFQFKAPFFLFTIGDSHCTVNCKDQHGLRGEMQLLYTFLESPIIFLSSPTNENVIFCLYDFDVHNVLIKINTAKPYSLPGPKGDIGFIVLKSSWEVNEASLDDWRQTLELVKKMPVAKFKQQSLPARDFGVFKQHFDKESVLKEVARQITLREAAGAGPRQLN
jgi:hypothetical protein